MRAHQPTRHSAAGRSSIVFLPHFALVSLVRAAPESISNYLSAVASASSSVSVLNMPLRDFTCISYKPVPRASFYRQPASVRWRGKLPAAEGLGGQGSSFTS
jgi:hypothetical protein